MREFIGLSKQEAIKVLEESGQEYEFVLNNFKISGDRLLVTNAKKENGKIILVLGEFIFDLKKD